MEDNHYMIINRYPSNQLIAKIQMKSNKIFPLILKPSKKKNIALTIGKDKYVQLDTACTTESACNSNEENSLRSIKKG
jgi:hypothetical protein